MARLILFLLGTLLCHQSALLADEPAWKVGVAKAEITPEKFIWMAGYAARDKPAEGKAQDLYAKACAFEDSAGNRVVIVTMDLISVPRALREHLADYVRQAHELSDAQLMVNCSHTHCGPELRYTDPDANERSKNAANYAKFLRNSLEKLIDNALSDLEPAGLEFYRARCGFAMNRRLPSGPGWKNSPNPEGPVDHEVPVLKVSTADKKTKAILFGYACHNTTLGFYEWCGDYAGYAQEALEEAHPGATALFVLGCGGDQNPYPRGTLELARLHGQTLATAVNAAFLTPARSVTGKLSSAYAIAELDYAKPFPTAEGLTKTLETSRDKYEVSRAERMLAYLKDNDQFPTHYPAPVQVIRFGNDLVILALPGETVVDYSLRLKKELANHGHATWVAGYSNDVFTYLPSKRVLQEGGYEGGGAMKYSIYPHPNIFADSVEDRLIGTALKLNKSLEEATGR